MKTYVCIAWFCLLACFVRASGLEEKIEVEAMVVTKAELRRHMSAPEADSWRPATYADLEASRGESQPDYLVLRFHSKSPGHYVGEVTASLKGSFGIRLDVALHYNKGWVEYFVPIDHGFYGRPVKDASPPVTVVWNRLETK